MPKSGRKMPREESDQVFVEQILKRHPLEPLLNKALGSSPQDARDAIGVLATLACTKRLDAELCLYGLLVQLRGQWDLVTSIVDQLPLIRNERAAQALFHEIRTVKSTPASRAYLVRVIRAISRFDYQIVGAEIADLAKDKSISEAWRRHLADLASEMAYRQ